MKYLLTLLVVIGGCILVGLAEYYFSITQYQERYYFGLCAGELATIFIISQIKVPKLTDTLIFILYVQAAMHFGASIGMYVIDSFKGWGYWNLAGGVDDIINLFYKPALEVLFIVQVVLFGFYLYSNRSNHRIRVNDRSEGDF